MNLDCDFWNDKYESGKTGWDLGIVSPPLKSYFDQIENKKLKILIPGAGRAHEVIYAYENGFKNTYLCDISIYAIEAFKKSYPLFPEEHILHIDFFDIQMKFDLIIEQTFFCALSPLIRGKYVHKMNNLLKPEGKLVGLLFSTEFNKQGPPFGGSINEYRDRFDKHFHILTMDECQNSIQPRLGNELFFIAKKK